MTALTATGKERDELRHTFFEQVKPELSAVLSNLGFDSSDEAMEDFFNHLTALNDLPLDAAMRAVMELKDIERCTDPNDIEVVVEERRDYFFKQLHLRKHPAPTF